MKSAQAQAPTTSTAPPGTHLAVPDGDTVGDYKGRAALLRMRARSRRPATFSSMNVSVANGFIATVTAHASSLVCSSPGTRAGANS